MNIFLFILLFLFRNFLTSAQTTTTVQGTVKDKDFPAYSIDSAYVKGVDLGSLETRFETFSDLNGFYTAIVTTSAVPDETSVPSKFGLSQNYPNPFNSSTKFEVSVSKPGNYKLEFFDVTGAELFKQEYDLSTGSYTFSVSGLGAAGVKFYRIIGEDVNVTKKMIQLDGSGFNPSVSVSSGGSFSKLGKVNNLEMRISAEKQGYFKDSADVSYVVGSTNTQDFSLSQVPKVDTVWFYTSQNLVPTNTPGDGASVVGVGNGSTLFSGTTNSAGEFSGFFVANYITNPNDSTDKVYTPGLVLVNVSRSNVVGESKEFIVDGSDITWDNDLQQTLISKNGNANGNVQNDVGNPVFNANVKLYNNDNNTFFGEGNTNSSGNYNFNYTYQGYENDPNDEHTPINELRKEATANNHDPKTIVKSFVNPIMTDFVLDRIPYEFNATLNLYKTLKGQVVTNLDSVMVQWPDGSVQGFANDNGIVTINKLLYTLNSDTTAQLFHNQPDKYLNWMVGHKVNPNRPDWLFQNENWTTTSKMPLNKVNLEGTIEVYMVPKWSFYGPNNDLLMDMESSTVKSFFWRPTFPATSHFEPSPAGWDTTDIAQFLFNETNNEPITQNNIDRANNEIQKFLTAVNSWPQKKLLNYRFTQISSVDDPFWQYLRNPSGRNLDNVSKSTFYQGGPGNFVEIANDGTGRIKYSFSKYSTTSSNGQIQEEVFDSMLNTNIDGPSFILSANIAGIPYTDLAQNLIGISYIFKAGTQYSQP